MALLESLNIPLGTEMPKFTLKDPDDNEYSSESLMGEKGLLVAFTCNHCPYAMAVWPRLAKIAMQAEALGINTVAINPNINPDYPDDAPDTMNNTKKKYKFSYPYLVDETQFTAKSFKAQCTPDIFLLDREHKLAYHGRIDDNWKDEHAITNHELISAVNALANGLEMSKDQKPSMGCSIKWVS